MTDKELIGLYVKFVPFLSEVLGPGCEIVIHDLTDPEHSGIICIANPLSGRNIGDPLTDLAKEIMAGQTYTGADYLTNYSGKAKGLDFTSSTYYIKNEGRIVGMLCINKDMTAAMGVKGALQTLLNAYNLVSAKESQYEENLESNVTDYLQTRIAQTIALSGVSSDRMNTKEKTHVVQRLKAAGIFKLQGAVQETSRQLGVSVPTVYRYLSKEEKG